MTLTNKILIFSNEMEKKLCVLVRIGPSSVSPTILKHTKVSLTSSASSQHRILLPDGSLYFLRAVRGEDDGTYWCKAYTNKAHQVQSQNGTLRVACE